MLVLVVLLVGAFVIGVVVFAVQEVMYPSKSFQWFAKTAVVAERHTTGLDIARMVLAADPRWNDCQGADGLCSKRDVFGFFPISLPERLQNEGWKFRVYIKPINEREVWAITQIDTGNSPSPSRSGNNGFTVPGAVLVRFRRREPMKLPPYDFYCGNYTVDGSIGVGSFMWKAKARDNYSPEYATSAKVVLPASMVGAISAVFGNDQVCSGQIKLLVPDREEVSFDRDRVPPEFVVPDVEAISPPRVKWEAFREQFDGEYSSVCGACNNSRVIVVDDDYDCIRKDCSCAVIRAVADKCQPCKLYVEAGKEYCLKGIELEQGAKLWIVSEHRETGGKVVLAGDKIKLGKESRLWFLGRFDLFYEQADLGEEAELHVSVPDGSVMVVNSVTLHDGSVVTQNLISKEVKGSNFILGGYLLAQNCRFMCNKRCILSSLLNEDCVPYDVAPYYWKLVKPGRIRVSSGDTEGVEIRQVFYCNSVRECELKAQRRGV